MDKIIKKDWDNFNRSYYRKQIKETAKQRAERWSKIQSIRERKNEKSDISITTE